MEKEIYNNNCDFAGIDNCTSENSEIRILPFQNGNMHLCKNHFMKERAFLTKLNWEKFPDKIYYEDSETLKRIKNPCAIETPEWGSLKVYKTE
jgi:hypothetical protein